MHTVMSYLHVAPQPLDLTHEHVYTLFCCVMMTSTVYYESILPEPGGFSIQYYTSLVIIC